MVNYKTCIDNNHIILNSNFKGKKEERVLNVLDADLLGSFLCLGFSINRRDNSPAQEIILGWQGWDEPDGSCCVKQWLLTIILSACCTWDMARSSSRCLTIPSLLKSASHRSYVAVNFIRGKNFISLPKGAKSVAECYSCRITQLIQGSLQSSKKL